tara:strand:- start:303 stop:914 length:612 start_codon:yes stop_codon:yes gene_type:complete
MIVFSTIMMMCVIGVLLKAHITMNAKRLILPISLLLASIPTIAFTYHMSDLWANIVRFIIGASFLAWFIVMYFKFKLAPDSDFIKYDSTKKAKVIKAAKEVLKQRMKEEDFKKDAKPAKKSKPASKSKKPAKSKPSKSKNEVIPIGSKVMVGKEGEDKAEGIVELFIPSLDMVTPGAEGKGYRVRMDNDNTILYYSTNEVQKV